MIRARASARFSLVFANGRGQGQAGTVRACAGLSAVVRARGRVPAPLHVRPAPICLNIDCKELQNEKVESMRKTLSTASTDQEAEGCVRLEGFADAGAALAADLVALEPQILCSCGR